MKKDLILFETAKLAKEKGFDEPVLYKYSDKGVLYISYTTEQYYGIETLKEFIDEGYGFTKNSELPWNDIYRSENKYDIYRSEYENEKVNIVVTAPTQSELKKWLRENHNIHVEVWYDNTQKDGFPYLCEIYDQNDESVDPDGWYYDNWEEALEEGLLKGLKLIV